MKKIIQFPGKIILYAMFSLILVMLNFSVASALESSGTTVKRNADGCTVDIIIQIAVDGSSADSANVKDGLEAELGGLNVSIPCPLPKPQCCKVVITIIVRRKCNIPAADQGKYHQIKMKSDGTPSWVSGLGGNGTTRAGEWRDNGSSRVVVHETLHLLGLPDQYCGRIRLRNGPAGPIKIERDCSPPNACCVPDTVAGARCTAPCPGHETDIMATTAAGTVVTSSNIIEAVSLAGLNFCPDPPCCPLVFFVPSFTYPTLMCAITTLNTDGVPLGGVTFKVDAGYVETGVNLTLNTPTANENARVVFQKNPDQLGPNPRLIVSAGGSGNTDGGIIIAGTDYVTFDQIDIDASAQPSIEWGYALVKRQNLAPYDGCQHVTINGCNITMNRTNVKSTGIYSGNHIATATTSLPITSTTDACNDTRIDNNMITDAFIGMSLLGYSAPSPYTLYDHNNEIGQFGKNTILNFGGANTAAYGIYVSAQDQIKIMNDSIISGLGSLNRLAGIFASGTSSSAEISNNYISVTSNTTTSQNAYGIWNMLGGTAASNCVRIHHNKIKDCSSTVPGSSAPLYGILNSAAADTIRIYDNTICGSNLFTTGSQYVIRSEASANNVYINNNNLYNITNTGTGGITLIYNQSSANAHIYSNMLNNCNANGGTVYGIYSALGGIVNIYKNNLYNINSNNGSTSSSLVYGIFNSSTPTINIYNNFISDLKAKMAILDPSVCGLNLTGGSSTNVYYNTIYLDQPIAGSTTFGSCAINSGTTTITTLRNNIFVNISAHGLSGHTVAHRRVNDILATYSENSNNNDFYAGPPGPDNLIYWDGINPCPFLSDYQALVAPRDALSFSENPPFNNTFLSPYNLHIESGVNTQCESGGSPGTIPAINEDYDGQPRFPNPGYPDNPSQPAINPDVGADEFAGGLVITKFLHLSVFLEGLYNSHGTMFQAMDTLGPKWPEGVADHITIELHNAATYGLIEYTAPDVELSTTGTAVVTIPPDKNGFYYITIKHRNSIETTSAFPVDFSGEIVFYPFDLPSKAYEENMTFVFEEDGLVSPPLIFGGDVSQDGIIEAEDLNQIGIGADVFDYGYLPTDVYGDGVIEGQDLNITGNNADAFVYAHVPM